MGSSGFVCVLIVGRTTKGYCYPTRNSKVVSSGT